MKKILLLTATLVASFAFTDNGVRSIPNVNVKKLNGESVNILKVIEQKDLSIIAFWATWCAPCKKELDAIADYYEEWQEEHGIQLIAVTIDNARALPKVRPMVETRGWEYIILSDANQDLQRALNFQTIPQTFLVNAKGEILYEHNGYVPGDEYKLEEAIINAGR